MASTPASVPDPPPECCANGSDPSSRKAPSILELSLKAEIADLWTERGRLRDLLDEKLFHLAKEMTRVGRSGKFTPFLRDVLGWTCKKPYKKAMRMAARYEFRTGLISKEEYDTRQGNRKKRNPLRGGLHAVPHQGVRPARPDLKQEFTSHDDERADSEFRTVAYSPAEIAAHESALERQSKQFVGTKLLRAIMPQGQLEWLNRAIRLQMSRHGTTTFKDTLFRVFLCGTKSAAPDDEWGQFLDEIFHSLGSNPDSAARRIQPITIQIGTLTPTQRKEIKNEA